MSRGIYTRRKHSNDPRTRSSAKDTNPVQETIAEEPVKLTAKLIRSVDELRVTFTAYSEAFTALEMRRADLAPKFMRICRAWQAETGSSFVAFVRVLIPDLPMERKGYVNHTAYMAAEYLRVKVNKFERENTTPVERARAIADKPASPRRIMTSVLASFLPLIDPAVLETLWAAM